MTDQEPSGPTIPAHPDTRHLLNRRRFVQGSGVAIAGAGVVTAAAVAQDATPAGTPAMTMPGMATPATPIGGTPAAIGTTTPLAPGSSPVMYFTPEEAALVDALASRIMPGTPDDPGAHEAGVVYYIDRTLHGANLGYDLKTYTQGPYLTTEEASVSAENSSATNQYVQSFIPTANVGRYGYQSVMTPDVLYRRGLQFVDAYAQAQYQKNFVDLTTDLQDTIVGAMADDSATGFDGPTAQAFFMKLRNDVIEGMFSDPMYGGNQNMVGWKLIGFPGAQMFYSPQEMAVNGTTKQPQSLMMMIAMESGG